MNQRTISRMTGEGPRDSVLWGTCSVWAHVCVPAQSIFRNCLQGSEQKHKHLLKRRKYQKRDEAPALSHNSSQYRHTPLQKDGPSTLGRWASDLGKTEIPFSTVPCASYRLSERTDFLIPHPSSGSMLQQLKQMDTALGHTFLSHKQRGVPEVKTENNEVLASLTLSHS